MRVRCTRHDDVALLEFVSGDVLDCYTADDVKDQAFRLLEGRRDVVVDLSGLEFVDSAGLGVLVAIYKRVRLSRRRVVVAGARPYVARVMAMIKLDRVFEAFPDARSALEALSAGAAAGTVGTGTPG